MIVIPSNIDPVAERIIRRAQRDIPIIENPLGSNRSPEIDAMCKRWGIPLGSAWCALWATDVWYDGGAEVPPIDTRRGWHPAKVETWRQWAIATNRFSLTPQLGAAPLYGADRKAPGSHMGCAVVSLTPIVTNFEGNTSETGYSREGTLTELKRVNVDRLIGYVLPIARKAA